jgi:hypothetical protein
MASHIPAKAGKNRRRLEGQAYGMAAVSLPQTLPEGNFQRKGRSI